MADQVFISYRRDGGDHVAKLIQERLIGEGYTVFYDRDSLHGGYFVDSIFDAIEACDDFLLILPKDSLERCKNSDDWVRSEIKHALKHKKNIIPVMLPGFTFPTDLPEDIAQISRINGVEYNLNYFDAVIETITRDRMRSKPKKKYDSPRSVTNNTSATKPLPTKKIIIGVSIALFIGICILVFSLTKVGKQLFCSHIYVTTTTEATCTDVGYTTSTCPKCGKIKTDNYTAETGHTFANTVETKPATCTENGTQYRECLACDFHEQIPIIATGHVYSEWVVDKEATNTENGQRHAECTVCKMRIDEVVYSAGSSGLKYEKDGDHYVLKSIGGCRDKNVVISSTVDGYPVTEIADGAFKDTDIESVIIPEGVVSIGKKAFYGCKSLKEISMPKSLKTIDKMAFLLCTDLETVIIPENVTHIGYQAFRSCSNLTNVTLSKSLVKIASGCFVDCWKLKELYYDSTTDDWDNVKVGLFAFNTGRQMFFSSTTIYCTDGKIDK